VVVLGVGDVPEPVLAVGPAGEPDAHLVHIQAHPSGDLVDGGPVHERLCDGHPPAGEDPIGQSVLDREQRDGVPGQLLGRDRVSDPVTGIDKPALM
jgi:hypothetical protein